MKNINSIIFKELFNRHLYSHYSYSCEIDRIFGVLDMPTIRKIRAVTNTIRKDRKIICLSV